MPRSLVFKSASMAHGSEFLMEFFTFDVVSLYGGLPMISSFSSAPRAIEARVNDVIAADMPVTFEFTEVGKLQQGRFDLSRLPVDATQMVRIVHIGDYDECLCVGAHVGHTAEVGRFRISSTRYENGIQRIVYRLDRK